MTHSQRWLLVLGIASAATLSTGVSAFAQPAGDQAHQRRRPPPPPGHDHPDRPAKVPDRQPTKPPPPPRQEKMAPRAGFVWTQGHWDWQNNDWKWIDGKWEPERAGKRWRNSKWAHQNGRWVYLPGQWMDDPSAPNARDGRPRQPPPPPQAERPAKREGYVWIPGRWDWQNNNWKWLAGRWEARRPGKRWRDARWEQQNDTYVLVEGDWIDDNGPPDLPRPPDRRPDRWRLDRPAVASYWPAKGKPGTRIKIHGRNFARDTAVMWAGKQVSAAKVTPTEITFAVPATAVSGVITLRAPGARPLAVGAFEVAAAYDAEAEWRKAEAERQRRAEQAWAERQKQLAKDRAAREAAVRQREQERIANRERRRAERIAELRAQWELRFLSDEETQAELTLHAQRMAQIARMRDLVEISQNGKLAVRIDVAQEREADRHTQRMAALKAAYSLK
ncbi:MAG: IPT/TIG domain-containing protein [Kofleriaceae bacterium]